MPFVPQLSYAATLFAGGFLSHGQSLTFTVNITGAWEIAVPVGVRYGSGVSVSSAVLVYQSNDGGADFDTEPLVAYVIPTAASSAKISTVRLPTGMYAVRVVPSSPSTTFFVLTQQILSAFITA